MATYAEYLKSNGASEDDIKVLDTPIARKAYERMEASVVENDRLRKIAETDKNNYQQWYEKEALPAYEGMQRTVVQTQADLARARAAVLAARDQGLADVAKAAGFDVDTPNPTAPPAKSDSIDASKFITADSLTGFMDQAGSGLAAMQDMVIEHSSLFPGQRLNVSQLRQEAVAAKKNIVQYWNDKYNVPAAREAAAKVEKEAYEKRLRDEGAAAERAKFADQYSNPDARPLSPSHNPFTQRADRDRTKQPWETSDRTVDRVTSATKRLMEQAAKTN